MFIICLSLKSFNIDNSKYLQALLLYEQIEQIEPIEQITWSLSDREKQIMTLRYGLNNTEEYTQKEVAAMLGISQSYISRIEKKVIKGLQRVMEIS